MAAAMKGYKLRLVVSSDVPQECVAAMQAYGADVIRIEAGIEDARKLVEAMEARGEGVFLDQFSNPNNPLAHLRGTGPELWAQTGGKITHLIAPLGSTGTCMGTSAYLKALNPAVQIVGLQPEGAASIPGLVKWSPGQEPPLFQPSRVDQVMHVTQEEAERTARILARTAGLLVGMSSGGAVSAALRLSAEVQDALIAVILADRGERYLPSGVFSPDAGKQDPRPVAASGFWSAVQCLVAPRAFPGPHFVLFLASQDPATGQPWCPESERLAERVRRAVANGRGTLLEVNVGSEAEWLDPRHPLRVHPSLGLRYIPTLMQWGLQGPKRRAAGDWDALQGLILPAQEDEARGGRGGGGGSQAGAGPVAQQVPAGPPAASGSATVPRWGPPNPFELQSAAGARAQGAPPGPAGGPTSGGSTGGGSGRGVASGGARGPVLDGSWPQQHPQPGTQEGTLEGLLDVFLGALNRSLAAQAPPGPLEPHQGQDPPAAGQPGVQPDAPQAPAQQGSSAPGHAAAAPQAGAPHAPSARQGSSTEPQPNFVGGRSQEKAAAAAAGGAAGSASPPHDLQSAPGDVGRSHRPDGHAPSAGAAAGSAWPPAAGLTRAGPSIVPGLHSPGAEGAAGSAQPLQAQHSGAGLLAVPEGQAAAAGGVQLLWVQHSSLGPSSDSHQAEALLPAAAAEATASAGDSMDAAPAAVATPLLHAAAEATAPASAPQDTAPALQAAAEEAASAEATAPAKAPQDAAPALQATTKVAAARGEAEALDAALGSAQPNSLGGGMQQQLLALGGSPVGSSILFWPDAQAAGAAASLEEGCIGQEGAAGQEETLGGEGKEQLRLVGAGGRMGRMPDLRGAAGGFEGVGGVEETAGSEGGAGAAGAGAGLMGVSSAADSFEGEVAAGAGLDGLLAGGGIKGVAVGLGLEVANAGVGLQEGCGLESADAGHEGAGRPTHERQGTKDVQQQASGVPSQSNGSSGSRHVISSVLLWPDPEEKDVEEEESSRPSQGSEPGNGVKVGALWQQQQQQQ